MFIREDSKASSVSTLKLTWLIRRKSLFYVRIFGAIKSNYEATSNVFIIFLDPLMNFNLNNF